MTASPPAVANHLAEYAAMVAAAIDSSHGNAGDAGKKSKFSSLFVEEYAEIAGIEEPDPCDSSIMTAFYRGLEEHKENKAAARKHIEKCLGPKPSTDPEAPREMTSIMSTETISAFRNLDLTADDTFVAFEERLKGFSLFSVAPAPVHLIKKAREGRSKCMEYELADYQKQEEIARANRVSTSVEMFPMTLDRVVDWTLQFKRVGGTAFGPKFILRPLLDRLLIAMQDQLAWQAIGKIGCMTMAWAIHKGIRAALGPKRNFKFSKQVVVDFEIGRAPHLSDMEEDIQVRILAAAGSGGGTSQSSPAIKHSASPLPSVHSSGKRGKFEYGDKLDGPSFTAAWRADVEALQAARGKYFKGTDFCQSQQDIEKIFGPEFLKLSP